MNNSQIPFDIVDDGHLRIVGVVRRGATEGVGLQYSWDGTKLGIKREDEDDYTYVELGADKVDITFEDLVEILGYEPCDKKDFDNHINNLKIHLSEDDIVQIAKIKDKANSEDVPQKLSDLEIDMEIGKNYDDEILSLNENKLDKNDLEGLGYMQKSEYDKDEDGIIDKAGDSIHLGGILHSKYALKEDIVIPETIDWDNIENKPTEFNPSQHNHDGSYYNKEYIDKEISRIESIIEDIDPEIGDLISIKKDIEELQNNKLDRDVFDIKISEIEDVLKTIPTKTSQLTNDSKYITASGTEIAGINTKIGLLEINKADKKTVSNQIDMMNLKISELEKSIEDINIPTDLLEEIQRDIESLKVDKLDIDVFNAKINEIEKTISEIEVPTKLSELENDTMFITKEDIPEADLTEIKVDINTLKINKADKVEVASEITRIEKVISDLDIPDEVDLQPILDNLNKLEDEKLSKVEFEVRLSEEILNLIDNAPEALDTLGKLAQALGEDPEFATTITNLISQKADTSKLNIEVSRLDEKIDNIDVPEGIDLTPIKKDIENIKQKDLSQDREIEDIKTVNKSQSERIDGLSEVVVEFGNTMTQSIQELKDTKADKSDILSPYHLGETAPSDTSRIWVKGK